MEESWEEKFRRECEDLHKNIEKDLDPDIDRLIKEYPNEKHFYNDKMESAAAVALDYERIEIYRLLTSKGICLGPHENATKLTIAIDPRTKQIFQESIWETNKKNSIEVADHISILNTKSRISHNVREDEVDKIKQCIRKAFIDLDQIPRIQPILKVVACSDKLSITFDPYDDKINNMDPTPKNNVRGCCYPTGRWEGDILIGAKNLMRADKKYLEVLGTLAHELTHYAMQLVYQNDCKPYNKWSQDNEKASRGPAEKLRKTEESSKKEESEKISGEKLLNYICKKCEENWKAEDSEPCINIVFQYPTFERHAELIVRVPQLLALHKNNEAKLSQIKSTYLELFCFFEEKVLVNIESVLSRLKIIYKLNQAYQPKQSIEHYVERTFIRLNVNFELPLTEDQLIDHTENVKILLVSDEPGAGKTTNLIAIAGKLKKRYPDHWIVVIDLKEFADCYKRDGDESTTFSTMNEIENYYCKKIFKFKNLEAKNFVELFEENRVIFLMDGFDEISPSYKEFNLKLINAITRKSDNRIWISTRPHLEKELRGKLKCSVFRLKPFTIDDRRKFLELKWKSEIDQKMLDEKIQKVENILDEITKKSWGLDPTSNPLILAMISEVVDELSNQTNLQMNLYSIYETFVNKKMKIFFKKGPEAEEHMIDPHRWLNIKLFHHEIALETLLRNGPKDSDKFWPLLCGRTTMPSSEEIARLGLMVYEENSNEIYKNFRFTHRTFAEYFVADFIIESFSKFNIREDYGTNEWLWDTRTISLEQILFFCTDSKGVDFEKLFNFILEKLLNPSHLNNLTMVRYFIYSFWKTRSYIDSSKNENFQNFEKALNSPGRFFGNLFQTALRDGSDCWFKDVPEALEVRLRSVEFWEPWESVDYSAMILSAQKSTSFFSEFLGFLNNFLDPKILRKMFFDVDYESNNILYICSPGNFKLILSDSPMIPLTRQEKEKLLKTKNEYGLNVLLYYAKACKSKEEFQKYYEIVKDFEEEMPEKLLKGFISSNQYQTILHYFLSHRNYLESSLEILREFFELKTIKEMFKIKDGFPTLLMLISRTNITEKFETFWNFFEDIFEDEAERILIMRQNAFGFSAFDFAFFEGGGYDIILTFIKTKYEIVYGEEEMKQRIIRNIFSFSEAQKSILLSRKWKLDTLMENVMSVFSKDFIRSLFLPSDGKPTLLKDKKIMAVLKPLLIKNKIFSEDEIVVCGGYRRVFCKTSVL